MKDGSRTPSHCLTMTEIVLNKRKKLWVHSC